MKDNMNALTKWAIRYEKGEIRFVPTKPNSRKGNGYFLEAIEHRSLDLQSKRFTVNLINGTLLNKHGEETQQLNAFSASTLEQLINEVASWMEKHCFGGQSIRKS